MKRSTMIMAAAFAGYSLASSASAAPTPGHDGNLDRVPYMSLDPATAAMLPGQRVSIDAYLDNVEQLGAYQVQVAVEGGGSGWLALDSIQIKQNRADFVFAGDNVVAAGDRRLLRAGAVTLDGGVNVAEAAYLATFTFHATDDANGLFTVYVTQGDQSLLRNSAGGPIVFDIGSGVSIVVKGDPGGLGQGDMNPLAEPASVDAHNATAMALPACAAGPVDFGYIQSIVFCFIAPGPNPPGPPPWLDISPCGVGDQVCNFSDIQCAVREFQGHIPGCL